MRINSSGFVGIGNTDPGALLHVVNSSDHGVVRIGGNNNGATGLDINYSNSATTSTTIKQNYRATSGNALLNIDTGIFTVSTGTAGSERMRINSDGTLSMGDPTTNGGFSAFVSDNGTAHQRGRFLSEQSQQQEEHKKYFSFTLVQHKNY